MLEQRTLVQNAETETSFFLFFLSCILSLYTVSWTAFTRHESFYCFRDIHKIAQCRDRMRWCIEALNLISGQKTLFLADFQSFVIDNKDIYTIVYLLKIGKIILYQLFKYHHAQKISKIYIINDNIQSDQSNFKHFVGINDQLKTINWWFKNQSIQIW